jgi:hypothetical protein
MASNLTNRLKKLESNTITGDEIQAIFRRIVQPGSRDICVAGWYFGHGDNRVDVLRLEDETDDDLRERAAGICREQSGGCFPKLVSIC